MDALAAGFAPVFSLRWWDSLRRELAPTPGRWQTTVRIVATVSLVVVISMALRIPEMALSCYMVFFATKENKVVTALTGVLAIAGLTIGIGVSLLLYHYDIDYPEIRIPMMAAVLFCAFFFSRVFLVGPLAFSLGFVIAATQSIEELIPSVEYLVRYLLWLWVAVAYPITLTVLVNQLLLPARPKAELLRELQTRLDLVCGSIAGKLSLAAPGSQADESLRQLATHSDTQLLKLLKLAEMETSALKERHAGQSIVIMAVGRMVDSAAALSLRGSFSPNAEDSRILHILHGEITRLRDALGQGSLPQPPPEACGGIATLPEIEELQRCTTLLYDGIANTVPGAAAGPAPKHRIRLLSEDAFTNPAHVHFALKVTMAAMLCYICYTAVYWAGIHTAFITCCFISLESTGATMRKGALRLTGCFVGSLAGFLSTMYLIPQMESIPSLVLLVAAVSVVAGWVAAGTERIAYAGLQIALAFYLSILQEYSPDVDLSAIRDRVAGIVFGILVTSIVFRYIWPERALDRLKAMLVGNLHGLARLIAFPQPGAQIETTLTQARNLRSDLATKIEQAIHLSELTEFETADSTPIDHPPSLKMGDTADCERGIFLTAALLANEASLAQWQSLAEPAQRMESDLRTAIAKLLDRTAAMTPEGTQGESSNVQERFDAWNNSATQWYSDASHEGRASLLRRLVEQVFILIELPTGTESI